MKLGFGLNYSHLARTLAQRSYDLLMESGLAIQTETGQTLVSEAAP